MARYFLRLKLTLVRNNLRSSGRRVLGSIFGLASWIGIVAFGLALLVGGGSQHLAVPLVFDTLFAGWLVLPLLGSGSDETLDPARLALLPLTGPQLMRGLIIASLAGVGPVATLVTASGTLMVKRPGLAGTLVVAVAVLVELLLCIAGSRAVTTAFSSALRSRRGRDVLVFVIAAAALVPALAGQIVPRVLLRHHSVGVRFGRALYWLPSGWAARAVVDARAGHTLAAFLEVLGAAVAAGIALWLWALALRRTLTSAEPAAAKSSRKGPGLFSRPLAFLPRNRVGAMAAKELRYMWRDPRRRASLLSVVVLLAFPALGIFMRRVHARELVLLAGAGGLLVCLQAVNQFGLDGPAMWTNVVVGGDPAADIRGKNLALGVLVAVVVVLEAIALALLSGGWIYVAPALLLGVAVTGVTLGVANQASVLAPYPVADTSTNLWGNNAGCLTALTGLVVLGLVALLLIPVIAAVALGVTAWPRGLIIVAAGAAAYGAILWRIGLMLASNRLRTHQLECLAAVSARSGA